VTTIKRNRDRWWPHARALAVEHPAWTEVEPAWADAAMTITPGWQAPFAGELDSFGAT
jgi:hypothetical protein